MAYLTKTGLLLLLLVMSISWSGCRRKPSADVAGIVFRDQQGRTFSEADICSLRGTLRYEVSEPDSVPSLAISLHEAGRAAGAAGRYGEALRLFSQAHAAAPSWAYPVYDAAWTYLLLGDRSTAERYYARVDSMRPRGFFTSKGALDCLRRERDGTVPTGTYLALVALEDAAPEARRAALSDLLARTPALPRAWQMRAELEADDSTALAMIERGLQYDPDRETGEMLLVNKAARLVRMGRRNEAVRLLGPLAYSGEATLGAEYLAKVTLASLLCRK